MKSYNGEIANHAPNKEIIIEAQILVKYLIACAHTEQVPYADHNTADVLHRLEVLSGVKTPERSGF
jgi:hypothetical protein